MAGGIDLRTDRQAVLGDLWQVSCFQRPGNPLVMMGRKLFESHPELLVTQIVNIKMQIRNNDK